MLLTTWLHATPCMFTLQLGCSDDTLICLQSTVWRHSYIATISEAEVTTVVKRLQNGKARGEDIINEMIRAFSEDHLHMLTQIFNVVLLSGHTT